MVVRLGEQAGDGVLREPGGIAVLALLGEAEEDERVVREGVARFAQGAGFHLVIRPVEHFADAAADEIGNGDWRGGMDVAGERIAPPPAQQASHFGRGVEVAAEAFDVGGRDGFEQPALVETAATDDFE